MMNSLTQDESKLLGSPQAISALAESDSATLLVISDSHGAYQNLFFILNECAGRCDALVFCGDGISDMLSLLEHAADEERFSEIIPPVVGFVEGNNDADIYPMKNPAWNADHSLDYHVQIKIPLTQTFKVCGHTVFVTHGHRHSLYTGTESLCMAAQKHHAGIALYGHSHVALAEQTGTVLALNPGSCSRPRAAQPPCYALLSLKKNSDVYDYTFYAIRAEGSRPFIPDHRGWERW